MIAIVTPLPIPAQRFLFLLALLLAIAVMVLPDCCLNGRHAFGAGMDAFGPICRAAR
jgi:hypothetical protein